MKIKATQTDGGKEFHFITTKPSSLGIIHRKNCPHISKHNMVVKTRNVCVFECGIDLLLQSNLPMNYWLYAFCTTVNILNKLNIKTLKGDIP